MATQEELKKKIMDAGYEKDVAPEDRIHKCNFCKCLNEKDGFCSVFKKEVPANFCGKVNKCVHWLVIKFDDPIPF